MSDKAVKLWATFFGAGYFPVAPGTWASFLGALLWWGLKDWWFFYLVLFWGVTAMGFTVAGKMEKLMKKKDPGCVVIDEVSGIMIAFFLLPVTPATFWTTFFLFRAFDMFKIYPANKLEALGGAKGIMMDDIVAGLYTNLIMQVATRVTGLF